MWLLHDAPSAPHRVATTGSGRRPRSAYEWRSEQRETVSAWRGRYLLRMYMLIVGSMWCVCAHVTVVFPEANAPPGARAAPRAGETGVLWWGRSGGDACSRVACNGASISPGRAHTLCSFPAVPLPCLRHPPASQLSVSGLPWPWLVLALSRPGLACDICAYYFEELGGVFFFFFFFHAKRKAAY